MMNTNEPQALTAYDAPRNRTAPGAAQDAAARRRRGTRASTFAAIAALACFAATSAAAATTAARSSTTSKESRAASAGARHRAAPDRAASSDAQPAPVAAVDARPRVLVTPEGHAFLVLRSGPEKRGDATTWDVLYLAGVQAAALERPDVQTRVVEFARELRTAFGPMAELAHVDRLSITALFGSPGASCALERRTFVRGEDGWQTTAAAGERWVAQFPPVDVQLVADLDAAVTARAAAAEFVHDADRADYDAAWASTSALVKAMMSRADFEQHLQQFPGADGERDGELYVAFTAPHERFLPGASMTAWFRRTTEVGPTLVALTVRLDDDMRWRVADVQMSAAPETAATRTRQGASVAVADAL